jgi:trigger factor
MNAAQYGMEPNEFAKAVEEAGQVPAMVGEVARRKALALVLEKATVTDASGRPVDLEALSPQAQQPEVLEQDLSAEDTGDASDPDDQA